MSKEKLSDVEISNALLFGILMTIVRDIVIIILLVLFVPPINKIYFDGFQDGNKLKFAFLLAASIIIVLYDAIRLAVTKGKQAKEEETTPSLEDERTFDPGLQESSHGNQSSGPDLPETETGTFDNGPGRTGNTGSHQDQSSATFDSFSDFANGETINNRYEIVRFIAKGGMGEVYEALDTELGDRIALKTIRPEYSSDIHAIERFKREILLARKISHPSICRLFHFEQHTNPRTGRVVYFISMELLSGQTLHDHISKNGAFNPDSAFDIVKMMAEGLSAAHAEGIIHRDFKSSNIHLVPTTHSFRVVITDFGLARTSLDSSLNTLTKTGSFVGTPAYMAPEQVMGKEATKASDIYSLGVVMYEMLTGRLPFEADSPMGTAALRLTEPPTPILKYLPELPSPWEDTVMTCLSKEPSDRFDDALDVPKRIEGR